MTPSVECPSMGWREKRKIVQDLATVLVKVGAVRFGAFTLASGRLSSYYVDLRTVPSFPGAYSAVIDAYLAIIRHEIKEKSFDAIAGVPTAGLTMSSPIALKLAKPMIYARREEKQYGTQKKIEGTIKPGWNILVIDDLITTGSSLLSTVESIRAEGGEVKDVVVLIDRLEGGRVKLKKAGVRLHSVTDILEISDILYSEQMIGDDEMKAIAKQVGKP
jgi:orotate phosphoribosyltransferase